jgi:hypothetical protein
VVSVTADGAYDAGTVYEAAKKKGDGHRVRVLIPPIQGAQPSSSRSPDSQRVEVSLACKILNTMTSLGRPNSYRVT